MISTNVLHNINNKRFGYPESTIAINFFIFPHRIVTFDASSLSIEFSKQWLTWRELSKVELCADFTVSAAAARRPILVGGGAPPIPKFGGGAAPRNRFLCTGVST